MAPQSRRKARALKRAEALRDPLRGAVLKILVERGPTSPSKIAREVQASVQNVNYHVKRLVELECAELVEERKSGGTVEHIYRSTELHLVETEEWEDLPPEVKTLRVTEFAEGVDAVMVAALRARTLGPDKHFHLTETRLLLDDIGRAELLEIFERTRLGVLDVQDRSDQRRVESGEEGRPMTSCLGAFEVPPANR